MALQVTAFDPIKFFMVTRFLSRLEEEIDREHYEGSSFDLRVGVLVNRPQLPVCVCSNEGSDA